MRTTSSSGMTFAGEKKCMPMTSCGRFVDGGDLRDVQRRGIGGEHRSGLRDLDRAS